MNRRLDWIVKDRVVKLDQLEWKQEEGEEYYYYESTRYTGKAELFRETNQKLFTGNFKEGQLDGLCVTWHTNGNRENESYWREGKLDGLSTDWYKKGKKEREGHWKNGKVISLEAWKPNGEKCLLTNVKDGNGLSAYYDDIQSWPEIACYIWMDGEVVEG
jgi:antitoxin component YwqK of YwqJK toxin-antitoxin module